MPIDFSNIGNVVSHAFDSDLIDIGRKTTITSPDGFEVETDPKIPLYKDIPCHIDYQSQDNPDVSNQPTKPIIMSLTIHCGTLTDVKNGDYITAYKRNGNGDVIEKYSGVAGEPTQYQSRMQFSVGVRMFV